MRSQKKTFEAVLQNANTGFAPIFVEGEMADGWEENEEFVLALGVLDEEEGSGGRPGKMEKRMNSIDDSGMENWRWRV